MDWLAATRFSADVIASWWEGRPDDPDERLVRIDALYGAFRPVFPGLVDIAPPRLDELADPLLVDVRPWAERRISSIPGAIGLGELADRGVHPRRPVVTFCTMGIRSGYRAHRLARRGHRAVNLAGGLLAWVHHGGALVTPEEEPTTDLHVAARPFDLTPEGVRGLW